MTSVLIYDEHCGWSPSLNASKGTGGTEVHLVQIATWLAARGIYVEAWCHDGSGMEDGVVYVESRDPKLAPSPCFDSAITVRKSRLPYITSAQYYTLVTDDPRPCPGDFAHLLGRSTLVCVSEWQADLYRDLGHKCIAIPTMIDDEVYDRTAVTRYPRSIGCFSAWNKGTERLLEEWPHIRRPGERLFVGSPYSEPDDAAEQCDSAGAEWVGRLKPQEVVDHLAHVETHVRVCTIGETFGATDALARALGCNVSVWCERDIGALKETVPGAAWSTRIGWLSGLVQPVPILPSLRRDYRVSTVMPKWLALVGGE